MPCHSSHLDSGYRCGEVTSSREAEHEVAIDNLDGDEIILIIVSPIVQKKPILVGCRERNFQSETMSLLQSGESNVGSSLRETAASEPTHIVEGRIARRATLCSPRGCIRSAGNLK